MDANASGEQLYDVLDTVEKLNFRRLFVGEDSTIFQEIFIETVHRFALSPDMEDREDVYENSCRHLIDEMRSSNPLLFSDRFLDIITHTVGCRSVPDFVEPVGEIPVNRYNRPYQAQAWNPQNVTHPR